MPRCLEKQEHAKRIRIPPMVSAGGGYRAARRSAVVAWIQQLTSRQMAQCKPSDDTCLDMRGAVPHLQELREVHAHVLYKGRGAEGGVGCHMDAVLLGPVPHMLIPVMGMHLHLPAETNNFQSQITIQILYTMCLCPHQNEHVADPRFIPGKPGIPGWSLGKCREAKRRSATGPLML